MRLRRTSQAKQLVMTIDVKTISLDPSIPVQRLSIRTSPSIKLNLTPVLRNIKLLII
jgi:hypothetical protein